MTFHFTNDVFLLNFAFETAERAFQRLVIAELNFCQRYFTCLSIMAILELTSAAGDLVTTNPAAEGSAEHTR